MSSEESGIPDALRQKFPQLQPIKSAPSLTTINGFGVGLYGKRDVDQETGTYVKTRCICAVFIPLFALDAYRVADAGSRQWYFFGKEALSSFARSWNIAMSCAVLMLGLVIGWNIHTSSPAYRAQQDLKKAAELMAQGQPLPAATAYQRHLQGPAAAAARQGFAQALNACLNSDKAQTAAAALRLFAQSPVVHGDPAIADSPKRGLALVEKFRSADAEGALSILKEVAAIDPKNETLRDMQIGLLKQIVAAKPAAIDRAVELALLYEQAEQGQDAFQVLLPLKDKLGSTEGARLLGQHFLREGNNDEAYPLLFPFVQARLEHLRKVEQSYTNTMGRASRDAIAHLNKGTAEKAFYDSYNKAGEAEKETLVGMYIAKWVRNDPACKRVANELRQATPVIHVTLELGMVQLNRAQTMTDPAARKTELQAAEKTFLAIQGLAGDTDQYRLFLGQVYYWLGRSAESQALFDELLAANQRSFPTLIALAGTLRQVGEEPQARRLTEEAYQHAKDNEERFEAASLRARLQTDVNDEIAWLEKCDPNQLNVQIELNSARGQKALQDGDRESAAQFFRKSAAGYEDMPRNAATLNNHGLACLSLYSVTGKIEDHDRGLALLQEAMSLAPGNSLLLLNTTHLFFARAYMDVVSDAIHFDLIKEAPDEDMLQLLYTDAAERTRVYDRLRQDEYLKKGLAYLDKTLLLAPKNSRLYWLGVSVHHGFRDAAELEKLQQRLKTAAPELSETTQEQRQFYSGARDKENLQRLTAEAQRMQTLLAAPGIKDHPLSLEFVRLQLIGLRQQLDILGTPADSRQVLEEAAAIYAQHPDAAALQHLVSATFFRAHQELKSELPEYAQLAELTKRSLAPRVLITLLLERKHQLAQRILQNPNARKAVELVKDRNLRFPTTRSMESWALIQSVDAAEAAALGRQLLEDRAGRLAGDMHFQLNPLGASAVLEQYWSQKLAGNEKRALEIYQAALRDGVPLPPL